MHRLFKTIGVALAATLLWTAAAFAQATSANINCDGALLYNASTNGATRLLNGSQSGQQGITYVCGYTLWAGGTASVSLVYGTGTNCATGETALTPPFALTAQTGVNDTSPFYRGLSVPVGKDLCIKTNAGVAVQGLVYIKRQGR